MLRTKIKFYCSIHCQRHCEGLSDEELDLLSTLLQLVGEALAVIPAVKQVCDKQSAENVERQIIHRKKGNLTEK